MTSRALIAGVMPWSSLAWFAPSATAAVPDMSKDPIRKETALDRWYRDHVAGGPGAFVLAAHGYDDFKQALRRKFVQEIGSIR